MKGAFRPLLRWIGERQTSFWLTSFVFGACAALLSVETWRTAVDRSNELEQATVSTINLARALAQHADDTIGIADSALASLVERLEGDDPAAKSEQALEKIIRRRVNESPVISGLFVFDEKGNWRASSVVVRPDSANDSSSAYFIAHRRSTSRQAFVGAATQSESRGAWILPVSRRVDHPNGDFAGIVLATIDLSYFINRYRDFDIGRDGSISLLNLDGRVLARLPFVASLIGLNVSESLAFREYIPKARFGSFERPSSYDRISRLYAYGKADRFPLIVLASVSLSETLAPWRKTIYVRMMIVGLIVAAIAMLGFWLIVQTRRRQKSENALALLASTDGLTSLANRRTFDERLKVEVRRAARDRTVLSVIMIDVDHFKAFNDFYGHPTGDVCLQLVSRAVAASARRPGDLTARYGGEEFAVLLPGAGADDAFRIAETIRADILSLQIPHEANASGGVVTASLGVASIEPVVNAIVEPSLVVQAADAALYRAKETGRNQTVAASALHAIGRDVSAA